MTTTIKTILASFFILLFISGQSLAQSSEKVSKTSLSLEIDPITFGFGGYSAHIRIQPKGSNHLLLGAGTYAMNLPKQLVNMHADNRNQGWQARINQAYGLFGEYHFSEVNHKWFVGSQLGWQENLLKNEGVETSISYANLLVMGYGGYSWPLFGSNLYLKAWGGIGFTPQLDGNNELGGKVYHLTSFIPFGTFHLGYRF